MSGHSKWHNIQKTKGAADAKRAQAFTKIAREMIVAVKEGGSGDPRSNSRLAAVIAKFGTVRQFTIAFMAGKAHVVVLYRLLTKERTLCPAASKEKLPTERHPLPPA